MHGRRFVGALLACVMASTAGGAGQARLLKPVEQLAATDPLGAVISSIDGTARQISALHDMVSLEAGQVRVVDVGWRLDDGAVQALDDAVARNARVLADLRVVLDNRPAIKQRLAEYDLRLKDVVGVRADTPDSVIVYVRR